MFHILFLCTANLYRSPLAAALFAKKLQADGWSDQWLVESAGIWTVPGRHVSADLLMAASARGLDLNDHVTRQLDQYLLEQNDLILVMERGHEESLRVEFPLFSTKVHLLSELADGLEYDIADPINSELTLDEVIAGLSQLMDRAYPSICKLAQACKAI